MHNFANVTSNVPATISDFNIDDHLNSFSADCCFIEEYDDNISKKRKITYNHNAAIRNIEANLEKYGLKLEVDSANLPVILSATITAETVSISAATAIVRARAIASAKALMRDRAWSLNQ